MLQTNININGMVGKDLPDKVVEHILKQNIGKVIPDVGDIRYKDYADTKQLIRLEQITEAFCDNLILYMLYPAEDLRRSRGNKAILNNTLLGNYNKIIREAFVDNNVKPSIINGKNTVRICKSNNLKHRITQDQLDRATRLMGTTYDKKITMDIDYLITFKVDLMDENLKNISMQLPTILKQLEGRGIYLSDIDITIDYAGTLDKLDLIDYLTKNLNYRLQGEHTAGSRTILDNDKSVGTNCLTYIYNSRGATVRAKLYNKFVCQMTSPGDICKEHITNFIDCPTTRLREVFDNELAKAHGITRTEITIYTGNILDYTDLSNYMREAYDVINTPLFYSIPLKNQYKAITDRIEAQGNTLCVIDRTHKKFYTAYYANSITGKIVGTNVEYKTPNNTKTRKLNDEDLDTFIEKDFNNKIDRLQQCNAIKQIPMQILNMYYDNEGTLLTTQQARIKMEGYTYPHPGRLKDIETVPDAFRDNKIIFSLGTKKNAGLSELKDYPTIIPIETKTKQEIKRITTELENAILHNNARNELNAIILPTADDAREVLCNYLKAEAEAKQAREIYELHNKTEQQEIKRKLVDHINVELQFKKTATSTIEIPIGNIELVCIKLTAKEDSYIGLYLFEGMQYYTCVIDAYCKKVLEKSINLLTRTEYKGTEYLHNSTHLSLDSRILNLNKKAEARYGSKWYNQYTNKVRVYAATEPDNTVVIEPGLLKGLKQELDKKEADFKRLPRPSKHIIKNDRPPVKVKDCIKLEDCNEGELLKITEVYKLDYRRITKYIMLDEQERYILSSYFLEDKLNNNEQLDRATILFIKCLKTRCSKDNKKIMDVEIRI
jgi:hypothetical protein